MRAFSAFGAIRRGGQIGQGVNRSANTRVRGRGLRGAIEAVHRNPYRGRMDEPLPRP
jgi:hypothetical protein